MRLGGVGARYECEVDTYRPFVRVLYVGIEKHERAASMLIFKKCFYANSKAAMCKY